MLTDLKDCKTRTALASILGVEAKELAYVLYKIDQPSKYTSFCISKKNGGTRHIQAPIPKLRFIQSRLHQVLSECCDDIADLGFYKGKLSFAFRKDRNIFENARPHVGKRFVLNLDIRDFFHQCNFGRVRGYFIHSKEWKLDPAVATVIAQIACVDEGLPQGSPSSPVIANLLGQILDVRLTRFLHPRRCTYSRYCDDITISTDMRVFPPEVAVQDDSWPGGWALAAPLEDIFARADFPINYNKLRMSFDGSKKVVTGLTVNRFPNIDRKFYRDTRSLLDRYAQTASCDYIEFTTDFGNNCDDTENTIKSPVLRLGGRLAFIYHIKSRTALIGHPGIVHAENPQFYGMMQTYAFARDFVFNSVPTVVTEGPSDIIHLKAAIRANPTWAPHMFDPKENRFLVKFARHDGLFSAALGMSGGTGNIGRYLDLYYSRFKRLNYKLRTQPSVIVVDNDKGSHGILKRLSNIHKMKLSTNDGLIVKKLQPFFYICKTPQVAGKVETAIEDLLPSALTGLVVGGKTFEPDTKKFDPSKNFGKIFLAKIVATQHSASAYANFQQFVGGLDDAVAGVAK